MSRGPGRWQRAILERLETVPAFYQFELFPSERARRKKSSNPDTLCGGPPCNAHPGQCGQGSSVLLPPRPPALSPAGDCQTQRGRGGAPAVPSSHDRPQSGRIRSRPMG